MRTRWSVTLVGMAAIVGLWSATALAHGFGGGRGLAHGAVGISPLILRSVGLTDAQREQIRQIVANRRDQFRTLGEQLRTAREQLAQKLYGPDAVTPADLAPLTQQIDQLRGQLAQLSLEVALEIRGVLTPEQLAQAAQTRQRVGELRREMRGLLGGGR